MDVNQIYHNFWGVLVAHQSVPVTNGVFGFNPWGTEDPLVHFGSPFGAISPGWWRQLSKGNRPLPQVKDLKKRVRLVVSATFGHTTAQETLGSDVFLPQRPAGTSNWSLVAHIFIGNGNLKRTPDTKV